MKTPTWAIVIGICLMLFGGCSVTKSIQAINMPNIVAVQTEMMEKMSKSLPNHDSIPDSLNTGSGKVNNEMMKNMAESMQDMFAMSEFTKTWSVRLGYIGLVVALIYIFSGIFLLIRKSFSIKLACSALILSMVFSVVQSSILASDTSSGLMTKFASFGNVFGIIIDLILLVVILSVDKSSYNGTVTPGDTNDILDRNL